MNIVVFGASGGTGIEIIQQALASGHNVTAFVRSPGKIQISHPNLSLFQGNVMDAAAVAKAIQGQEIVISALGPTRPPIPEMMAHAARNIIAGMQQNGVRRLVYTSGAGVRAPQDQPQLMDHIMKGLLTLMAGSVLADSEKGVNIIRSANLDWTVVRFPRLVNGPVTGKYRVGYLGKGAGFQISRADGAHFVVQEMVQNQYLREMPFLSS